MLLLVRVLVSCCSLICRGVALQMLVLALVLRPHVEVILLCAWLSSYRSLYVVARFRSAGFPQRTRGLGRLLILRYRCFIIRMLLDAASNGTKLIRMLAVILGAGYRI